MENSERNYRSEAASDIVYAGLIAAAYYVLTIALGPISYGPLQFRAAGLLVPSCLLSRRYVLGLTVGICLANLYSPFGWYDFIVMPLLMYGIMFGGNRLRHTPLIAIIVMASLSALAVAIVPLQMGGGIPWWPTAAYIFIAQLIAFGAGWYGIWRHIGRLME